MQQGSTTLQQGASASQDSITLSPEASASLGLTPFHIPEMGGTEPAPVQQEAQGSGEPVIPQQSGSPDAPQATPAPTPTVPDFKAIFGDEYDNEEKVKGVLKEYGELKGKLTEYEQKVADLDHDNDYIKSLRTAIKNGRSQESHDKVYYSDPTKMTPAEKVALQMQWDDGIDAATANKLVNYKYKLGEQHDVDDPDVDMARTLLEVDAKKAEKFIEQHRQRESAPVVDDSLQKQIQAWTPIVPSIASSVAEITIPGSDYKHKVSSDTIKAVEKFLVDFVSDEGVEVDINNPQAKEELHQIAQKEIWWREKENIMKAMHTEWEKAEIRKKSVVPPPQGTQQVSLTSEQENAKILAKALREGV